MDEEKDAVRPDGNRVPDPLNPLAALLGPNLIADLKVLPDQLDTFIERSQALSKRLLDLKNNAPPNDE